MQNEVEEHELTVEQPQTRLREDSKGRNRTAQLPYWRGHPAPVGIRFTLCDEQAQQFGIRFAKKKNSLENISGKFLFRVVILYMNAET